MNNPVSSVCIPEPAKNQRPDANLNPFDPSRLRLSQDFVGAAGVKKILTTVPVRKPSKEWFIRTHCDSAYHINSCVIGMQSRRWQIGVGDFLSCAYAVEAWGQRNDAA